MEKLSNLDHELNHFVVALHLKYVVGNKAHLVLQSWKILDGKLQKAYLFCDLTSPEGEINQDGKTEINCSKCLQKFKDFKKGIISELETYNYQSQ